MMLRLSRRHIESRAVRVRSASRSTEQKAKISLASTPAKARWDRLPAHQVAARALNGQIFLQANVIAFEKLYLMSGAMLLAALPLLFLFKTGEPTRNRNR